MAENTKISWATHSFSPWIGCSKVHAGCQQCYAEAMAGRLGVTWGPNGTRRRTAESTWRKVEKWNRDAAPWKCTCPGAVTKQYTNHLWPCPAVPDRPRVFPSLCDPFEDWQGDVADWGISPRASMDAIRSDFFSLIDRCQNLDFLLLTKRPQNIQRMWPDVAGAPYIAEAGAMNDFQRSRRENCWLLYSASDQQTLHAGVEYMQDCADLCSVWGLSLEPLLAPVDLSWMRYAEGGMRPGWIIVGGESGPHARPMPLDVLEMISEQCDSADVPLFVKQDSGRKPGLQGRIPDRLWARKEFPL